MDENPDDKEDENPEVDIKKRYQRYQRISMRGTGTVTPKGDTESRSRKCMMCGRMFTLDMPGDLVRICKSCRKYRER